MSRRSNGTISQSLKEISKVIEAMAEGDVEQEVYYEGRDEVGDLANSVRKLITYLREFSDTLERAGKGDLTVGMSTRSHKDALSNTFNLMLSNIHSLISQVKTIANEIENSSNQL